MLKINIKYIATCLLEYLDILPNSALIITNLWVSVLIMPKYEIFILSVAFLQLMWTLCVINI